MVGPPARQGVGIVFVVATFAVAAVEVLEGKNSTRGLQRITTGDGLARGHW
ncbi:hypothetical protein GALL_452620 [mine drainage metagenome]|uniref:Uncharacterized protein n=1 Tax=mine drainage metagenome TaxID=410659 RepID=A0A1J5PZ60_9ZZZZ